MAVAAAGHIGCGELNTFNVLRLARPIITERHSWNAARHVFETSWTGTFKHTPDGWF